MDAPLDEGDWGSVLVIEPDIGENIDRDPYIWLFCHGWGVRPVVKPFGVAPWPCQKVGVYGSTGIAWPGGRFAVLAPLLSDELGGGVSKLPALTFPWTC